MYTEEGNKLLKEVKKLAQGTIFRVEDMEGQYDMFDRIEITTQVVSFVVMTAAKEKAKRQKTIKFIENIQKIANKYGYDVVDCMNYGYSEDDMWDFIESNFSISNPTKIDEFIGVFVIERMLSEEEMDNLDESNNFNAFAPCQTSLMESFNGFADL